MPKIFDIIENIAKNKKVLIKINNRFNKKRNKGNFHIKMGRK